MKILIVDNAEPQDKAYTQPLVDNLSRFAGVETVHYNQVPPQAVLEATYHGIVLSGAPVHYDFDIIDSRLESLQWVKTIDLPVLGVCLGHQNIGRLYGATMTKDTEAEASLQPIRLTGQHQLFDGLAEGDLVAAHHRASISLPEGFSLLASTATCINHAMKHNQRDIYSVQFHAELSDAGINVLANFVDIAKQRAAKATSH